LGIFLIAILKLLSQRSFAGEFYLPDVGSPGSVSPAGVSNVVTNFGTDLALSNPAGMTGLKKANLIPTGYLSSERICSTDFK
jgi:hypothetical protein